VWRDYSFSKRASHIKKMKQFIRENRDEIVKTIADCGGKTKTDALATEVIPVVMAIDWYADHAGKVLREKKIPSGHILFANKTSYATYVPLGLIGIVSPWNYAFSIPFGEIIMGLMSGNAVVLKVASCSLPVGEMIQRIIDSAELPSGLFRHIILGGADVPKVFFNPNDRQARVDKLFFTGSVAVGKELMKDAADTLTPLSLELGGNDPAIIMPDADLHRAAAGCAWAGYQNAGQSCGGVERIYCHESVYPRFVDLMKKYTSNLKHGNDDEHPEVDIGSLTTSKQLATVRVHLEDAVSKGAQIVAQSRAVGDVSRGYFHPATLLVNVTEDMLLMKEETFGPLLPIVPFTDVKDAIRMANNSDLGLTASVWSNGRQRHRIARQLNAGVVVCNDHLYTHGRSELAWRGFKNSGLGSTHGEEGLKEMCELRTIDDERMPFIGRNLWYYPHGPAVYEGLIAVFNYLNPSGFFARVGALVKLSGFAMRMFTHWKPTSSGEAKEGEKKEE